MATKTMPVYNTDIFLYEEADFKFSRDQVTVISGQNLAAGTVVGKITASGKYTILAPAASDGSQVAAGVMEFDCNASAADTQGVVVSRMAIVKSTGLVWPGGISGPQKTTALGQLLALGIKQATGNGTEATGVVN